MEILSGRGDSILLSRYTGGDSVLVKKKEWGGFCPGGFCPTLVSMFCRLNMVDLKLSYRSSHLKRYKVKKLRKMLKKKVRNLTVN